MAEIRVAIVGVGNSASALIQGVEYYKNAEEGENVPGLMHVNFGGYHVRDIKFVAAFDVDKNKIGKDLSEAIFVKPNCCVKFAEVPKLGVKVQPGPVLDGVAEHMRGTFNVYNEEEIKPADVASVLREAGAEILVNYLPVGSYNATRVYAQAALDAGCAFVNCIPEFIASDPLWRRKFEEKGLPVAGDDVKSQLGATILHRNLVRLCVDRGVIVDETYQLNLGGDTDFLNMTVEERLKTKRVSKTEAVKSLVPYDLPTRIGPSDYVPFLGNKKICYIWLKGRKFGDRPLTITVKLEVEDSPNSAGVVIDVIRAVKLALDRKIAGPLISISAYAFKHPPVQVPDPLAKEWVEEYIRGRRER
ncbi:MAG: inositol-3-phosphate synthase [Candidatus Bathyarchaeota archaeon]|nr:inositol-3-phosphate synthase [Candidatus Bathyarchaeota archaeon]MDW8040764.1 inositol-3-phosphate synthase [Nitrososphaerota archaeon]